MKGSPFAQERETAHDCSSRRSLQVENCAIVGALDLPHHVDVLGSHERRQRLEETHRVMVAGNNDDRAAPSVGEADQACQCYVECFHRWYGAIEEVAGVKNNVDVLILGDGNDLIDNGPVFVGAVVAPYALADVPVGRV
jgi:hypothetical protein